jgi:hypothetical protein
MEKIGIFFGHLEYITANFSLKVGKTAEISDNNIDPWYNFVYFVHALAVVIVYACGDCT